MMWKAVNKMTDPPDHDCLVAFTYIDQKIPGEKLDDPENLGASVGWLSWDVNKTFWSIMEDGEPIMSTQVTAICEIPLPENITAGTGAYPSTNNKWNELDSAARANLGEAGFEAFERYKQQLFRDGHEWDDDAYDVLTGYIWDESEEPYEDDNE